MSERTTDQRADTGAPEQPQGIWVKTGKTRDDSFVAGFAMGQQPDVLRRFPYEPAPAAYGLEAHEATRSHLTERTKKRIRDGLVMVAIGGIIVGSYNMNAFNMQGIVHNAQTSLGLGTTDTMANNGITMNPLLTNRPESLSPDNCLLPAAEYGVLTVSGTYPIEPILTDKVRITPYVADPYMNVAHEKTLPVDWQSRFQAFETKSQYPEMIFYNLPLGITICDTGGGIVPNPKGDGYSIDRTKLQVMFKDPSSKDMLNAKINIQPQIDGISTAKLKTNHGEWASYPLIGQWLYNGTDKKTGNIVDPVLNKSVAAVVGSMQDPQVIRTLTAIFETQAVSQVASSSVTKQSGITFPNGITSSRDFFDTALANRLGVKLNKITFKYNDDYILQMDTPTNPTTKKTIVEQNSIKTMDLSAKANLTAANIVYGYPSMPTSTSSSPPSQMPTSSPTQTNAP